MPNALAPLHINHPGILGLNTQDSAGILPGEWATLAQNLVLNQRGRLTVAPGMRLIADTSNVNFEQAYSHVDTGANALDYGVTSAKSVYQRISDTWTLQTVNAGVGGIKDSNAIYRFAYFNGATLLFANSRVGAGYLRHVQTSSGGAFSEITASSGSVPTAHDILAAFGRVWALDTYQLHWSGLLDYTNWQTGGGTIDLRNVWPTGVDEPLRIQEFNGYLVIFGRKSIIVYQNGDDVANIEKVEAIGGIGLAHPNAVQDIGTDLLFMSQGGLTSFSRTIQEKSMPMSVVAPQVRDDMVDDMNVNSYTIEEVSSAYSERLGWFVLNSGIGNTGAWIVHTKQRDANGFMPVTVLPTSGYDSGPSLSYVHNDPEEGMVLCTYTEANGYPKGVHRVNLDSHRVGDTAAAGTGGDPWPFVEFTTGWLDFSEVAMGDRTKILKELRLIFQDAGAGASTDDTMTVNVYGDYDDTNTIFTQTLDVPYDASLSVTKSILDIAGEVDVLKINIKITDPSDRTSLTRLGVYAKAGKLSQ